MQHLFIHPNNMHDEFRNINNIGESRRRKSVANNKIMTAANYD